MADCVMNARLVSYLRPGSSLNRSTIFDTSPYPDPAVHLAWGIRPVWMISPLMVRSPCAVAGGNRGRTSQPPLASREARSSPHRPG